MEFEREREAEKAPEAQLGKGPASDTEKSEGVKQSDQGTPAITEQLKSIQAALGNVDAMLEKQAGERKGSGKAVAFALVGAFIYVVVPYFYPHAGKLQHPVGVELTSMLISQSLLQSSYNQRLEEVLEYLPHPSDSPPKFQAKQWEVINKIMLLNGSVVNSARLAHSVDAFLPILKEDLLAQEAVHALSDQQIEKLRTVFNKLGKINAQLDKCSKQLDAESMTYQTAMAGGATDAHVSALIQMNNTLLESLKGKTRAVECMRTVEQFSSTFPELAQVHDEAVNAFNERADRQAKMVAWWRTLGGMILFFVGNATRAFIQGKLGKLFKKKKEKE